MPELTQYQRLPVAILAWAVLLFLILPTFIIFPISFSGNQFLKFPPDSWSLRWYYEYFGSTRWRNATVTSLKVAVLTTILCVPIGIAAAYGILNSNFRGVRIIRLLVLTPIIVPSVIVAIAIFFAFVRFGLVATIPGIVIAHSVLAMPFAVLTVYAGLAAFDMSQELVARSLGASRFKAFMTVTLPQIRTNVVVAAIFVFLSSIDEVVVSLFVSAGQNATLTREMFRTIRDEVDPTISAVSTLFVTITLLLALVAYLSQIQGQRNKS